jgi:hypothetical protein
VAWYAGHEIPSIARAPDPGGGGVTRKDGTGGGNVTARRLSHFGVAPPAQHSLADPADRVTFDDGVRLALLAMLQRLSPADRVVFVLHDIFQMPFPAIAETLGRAAPACRQLARRARQKIAARQDGVRFDIASAEHRGVTEKFIAACANGDLSGLLEVLAPDAWGEVDLGPGAVATTARSARGWLHAPGARMLASGR